MKFPGESDDYRKARDEVLQAEIGLRRQTEAVAAARRALPPGGPVPDDYVFEGVDGAVRLSELFENGKDSLVLYSMMYGPEMPEACPSCTSICDGLDSQAVHITQQVNLAVVAKSPLPRILAHAATRGWRHVRLLSSATNTYNRDYFGETERGQMPMLNVFRRDPEGGIVRHFWASELAFVPTEPGQNERHVDFLWPLWNVLDVTPGGRDPDWQPALSYPA